MGKSILSSTIAKIGTPISEENNKRRKTAFKDIASCLERCYREFIKYNQMKNSESGRNIDEAFENEEKMVNLINELKGEVNEELLRIACFSRIVEKDGLTEIIQENIDEIILKYTDENDQYHNDDLAKKNVAEDFNEMIKTMVTKKLDHIRRYPSLEEEKIARIVPLVQPPKQIAGPRRSGLAQWQISIMNGQDDGFFRATEGNGRVVDLDEYRKNKNNDER